MELFIFNETVDGAKRSRKTAGHDKNYPQWINFDLDSCQFLWRI